MIMKISHINRKREGMTITFTIFSQFETALKSIAAFLWTLMSFGSDTEDPILRAAKHLPCLLKSASPRIRLYSHPFSALTPQDKLLNDVYIFCINCISVMIMLISPKQILG